METRTALRGSAISKSKVAVVAAVLAAFMLGGTGGYLIKTLTLPAATAAQHIVQGQPGGSGYGSAWNYSSLRSGTMSVEGPAPAESSFTPKFREPGTGRSGPQI